MSLTKEIKLQDGTIYYRDELILRKKAKEFYSVVGHPELLIMRFLDVVTSDDGKIREEIPGKGRLNATISNMLFGLLEGQHIDPHRTIPIKTHQVGPSLADPTECLVRRVMQAIPIETIIRNQAWGSFSRNYGMAEGTKFEYPTCEFTLKDDAKNDPLIPEDHIIALGIATREELQHMREVALAVNQIMLDFFLEIGIELIDFKLVFGRQGDFMGDYTNLRLIGEISPDTCRLRELKTGKCLDKDIFRQGLSGLTEAYSAVCQKMFAHRVGKDYKGLKDEEFDGYGNSSLK